MPAQMTAARHRLVARSQTPSGQRKSLRTRRERQSPPPPRPGCRGSARQSAAPRSRNDVRAPSASVLIAGAEMTATP